MSSICIYPSQNILWAWKSTKESTCQKGWNSEFEHATHVPFAPLCVFVSKDCQDATQRETHWILYFSGLLQLRVAGSAELLTVTCPSLREAENIADLVDGYCRLVNNSPTSIWTRKGRDLQNKHFMHDSSKSFLFQAAIGNHFKTNSAFKTQRSVNIFQNSLKEKLTLRTLKWIDA